MNRNLAGKHPPPHAPPRRNPTSAPNLDLIALADKQPQQMAKGNKRRTVVRRINTVTNTPPESSINGGVNWRLRRLSETLRGKLSNVGRSASSGVSSSASGQN